ncbi:DUF3850 domain-containing protein [Enterobacter kobei]
MSTVTKEPVTHNLKIWPEYFSAVRDGLKRAELRWNDREYKAGVTLDLCEWDPNEEVFTGDFISVIVTHVAELGQWMPGYVLLSIAPPAPLAVPDDVSGPLAHAYKELTPTFMRNHIDVFERYGIYPDGSAGIQAMRIALDGMNRRAAMPHGAEPVTTANKLRDAVEIIRSSGIEIDAEKIFAGRDALNTPDCWCRTCRPITMTDMRFVVCHVCGNKRCPHANDHRNACTGSNEPGQEGSAYPAAPQQEVK